MFNFPDEAQAILQSNKYLEKMDLELDDISINFSTTVHSFSIDAEHEDFEYFSAKYVVEESEHEIGDVSFHIVDAAKIPVANIREIADGISFNLYETVSSIRIFENKEHAIFEKERTYINYYRTELPSDILETKDIVNTLLERGISPYPKGFEYSTFEMEKYHKETVDVWGKILILNDIKFYGSFNKNCLTPLLTVNLIKSLKYLGYFDWLLVNPNISEDYLISNNYPVSTNKEYNDFLESLGFNKTIGRLRDNRFCYYMKLK